MYRIYVYVSGECLPESRDTLEDAIEYGSSYTAKFAVYDSSGYLLYVNSQRGGGQPCATS